MKLVEAVNQLKLLREIVGEMFPITPRIEERVVEILGSRGAMTAAEIRLAGVRHPFIYLVLARMCTKGILGSQFEVMMGNRSRPPRTFYHVKPRKL